MDQYDVVIIGAGAAGMMCAIEAGRRGRRVMILEKAKRPGEKIRISGGGRCNFTNMNCAADRYISRNPHFCKSALARYTQHDFVKLVKSHNINFHEKTLGQLFCDERSQAIIDMLCDECAQAGVAMRLEAAVESVTKDDDGFTVTTDKGLTLRGAALVVATGGPSIPKMGATGFAYDIARQFGLTVLPTRAGLVPLTFTDETLSLTKALSGVAVDPVAVTCGRTTFREALLFTHRGLSGPAILQISSYWTPGDSVSVNLLPDRDMRAWLKDMKQQSPRKMLVTVLADCLPERLADHIATAALTQAGKGKDARLADLSDAVLHHAADHINRWVLKPNGTEGYRTAEVTIGGISTDELSAQTFESKKVPGLHFIGEAVDVTGWLGGYNFQWAWSSGWCCGQVV